MNLDKYEKIDGREALKRLVDGENIYVDESTFFHLPTYNELLKVEIINGKPTSKKDWVSITEFFEHEWFVKKPFDVRQAMLERPNEWVGAVEDLEGNWCKIGFDKEYFVAVEAPIEFDGVPKYFATDCARSTKAALDACIPIEDAPKEA